MLWWTTELEALIVAGWYQQ